MRSTSETTVTRRKVFYIPGYDPFPPRRYRELYRKEGAGQARISNYSLSMAGAMRGDGFGWQVRADIDGQPVTSDIEVLVWSDIVQESFNNSIPLTYGALARTAWIYISTGALWRLMRLRKGPVIAALYPVGMLLAQLGLAIFVAVLVYALAHAAIRIVLPTTPTTAPLTYIVGLVLAGMAMIHILRRFRDHDRRFFAHYLMHDFAHSASHRGAYPPEICTRLAMFGNVIGAALNEEVDEVLIVGHSSGAHMAVSVLATLIRAGRVAGTGPALGFLSLGQVVPMITFLPGADRLRADLKDLSTCGDLTWVDVTAPGDGCSFALCDPVAVSGQSTPQKRWPLVFSAAFTQSLSPARWRALRWRFFRLHFQYLCAFDRPKDYDYFQITAGPLTLAERYRGRPPSRSRIDRTVSKYTSTRP